QGLEAPHTGDHVKIVQMTGYGWTDARRYFDQSGAPASVSTAMSGDSRAAAPAPKPKPGPGGTYAVKPHDTLWALAARTLGDPSRWQEIYALNRDVLSDPFVVPPGTVLRLPGPDASAPSTPTPIPMPRSVTPSTPTPIPVPRTSTPQTSAQLDAVRQQATQMVASAPPPIAPTPGSISQSAAQTVGGVPQAPARIAYASSYFVQQAAPVPVVAPAADPRLQQIMQGMAAR
ncbi:MAG TPA: LysM peptidoglycan-binding domain-containing protein, partial [Oscillatoriaceae cyanobacterium]